MANLGKKDGIFHIRFRYQGREFKKSLKIRDRGAAEAAKNLVELTTHRLLTGQIAVPEAVDVGDFILSGGTLLEPAKASKTECGDGVLSRTTPDGDWKELSGGRDLEANAAVLESGFRDGVALLAGFDLRPLDRVHLQEAVQMDLISPFATVCVAADFTARDVDDGGVGPARELHDQAALFATEELGRAFDGGRQPEPVAGGGDCDRIACLAFHGHNVAH